MLCSDQITLSHPYYNTESGKAEWESSKADEHNVNAKKKLDSGMFSEKEHGEIILTVSVEVPDKFENFIYGQERRARHGGM